MSMVVIVELYACSSSLSSVTGITTMKGTCLVESLWLQIDGRATAFEVAKDVFTLSLARYTKVPPGVNNR